MHSELIKQTKVAARLLIMLTLLTGVAYPAFVTVVAQLIFPHQANGSLIEKDGKKLGSELIGQAFSEAKYFWGRPSATTPYPYNALASNGSNLGPLNMDFLTGVKALVENFKAHPHNHIQQIPVDLVTASGSGIDPEISPYAAFFQVERIARARKLSEETIKRLVEESINGRLFGVFGQPRVNVLQLNLKLDTLISGGHK